MSTTNMTPIDHVKHMYWNISLQKMKTTQIHGLIKVA
jgi:hypothetical protein